MTRTPAGAVVTYVSEYQDDDILLSISESKLPGLVAAFAGPGMIFKSSKGNLLHYAHGREVSSERIDMEGADAALVMHFESVDFDEKDRPGFSGLAIIVMASPYVYVVNSMITKETAGSKAFQEKLVNSLTIKLK